MRKNIKQPYSTSSAAIAGNGVPCIEYHIPQGRKAGLSLKSILIILRLLILAVLPVVLSCAQLREVGKSPPIEGNPDLSGIIIVNCEIIANFQDHGLLYALLGIDDHAETTSGAVAGVDGILLEGRASKNVIVFPNLQPGTYKVAIVRGDRAPPVDSENEIYNCSDESCPDAIELEFLIHTNAQLELTFEVNPGDVVYAGKLIFNENHDPPFSYTGGLPGDYIVDFHQHKAKDEITIKWDKKFEIEALENAIAGFKRNHWIEKIERRLKELKQE
jgi:hypothetical protein